MLFHIITFQFFIVKKVESWKIIITSTYCNCSGVEFKIDFKKFWSHCVICYNSDKPNGCHTKALRQNAIT